MSSYRERLAKHLFPLFFETLLNFLPVPIDTCVDDECLHIDKGWRGAPFRTFLKLSSTFLPVPTGTVRKQGKGQVQKGRLGTGTKRGTKKSGYLPVPKVRGVLGRVLQMVFLCSHLRNGAIREAGRKYGDYPEFIGEKLERAKGFEPSTLTLAR